MIKINESIGKNFNSFRLYIDDLEKIIEIFERSGINDIRIVANGYELKKLNDLSDCKFKNINKLEISTQKPYFSIGYDNNKIFLYVKENNNENTGIYVQLENIILQSEPRNLMRFKKIFYALLYLPIIVYILYKNEKEILIAKDIYILLCYSPVLYFYDKKLYTSKGLIFNYYSSSQITFWSRNKDNILVSLISIVAGSVLTLIIQEIASLL